ncbi:hypothetical protein T4E_434 [Trichinella pseudospiralis]|uniref:Uncharacterized protein n=1 Tax=Trichinella pseudospiralis TaxID=6337 RepID=A0A0V0XEI5_TRIPS|nr:hypothetical protein T4E_434 [Trichinella pseudospiralis]
MGIMGINRTGIEINFYRSGIISELQQGYSRRS